MNEATRPSLVGMDREELGAVFDGRADARLRAKQIAHHIYARAVDDFDEMRDLPKDLREELKQRFGCLRTHPPQPLEPPIQRPEANTAGPESEASGRGPRPTEAGGDSVLKHRISPLHVANHRKSADGVEKLLVHNGDDQVYECVLLPYEDRVSCCISSQVGCPMGCKFCATGLGGFDRNLTAGEIVGQYLLLQRLTERRISHVVFMGMGEPLLNLPNVLKALKLLHDEVGLSYRHLTVSTVGLVPQIRELADKKLPIHLALSLHSPLDEVRNKLMPVNHKWPVAEVMGAMRAYGRATGRKITIEYLLIKGITDTPEQARALVPHLKGVPSVVNLIPFNWVDTEQGFARPDRERVRAFRGILERAGVNVTERVERGHDIAAACGQLAGQHQGRFARRERSVGLPVLS